MNDHESRSLPNIPSHAAWRTEYDNSNIVQYMYSNYRNSKQILI